MILQIAIIENDTNDLNLLSNLILKYFETSNKTKGHSFLITHYTNGYDLLESKNTFDIIFMDIDMPQMDGMETSYKLREINKEVPLVFVTNLAQKAIEGYKVNAKDFCLKPATFVDIQIIFDSLFNTINKQKESYLFIKKNNSIIRIKQSNIEVVEMNGHDVFIYYYEGDNLNTISYRSSMKKVLPLIDCDSLIQVSSGAIINISYILSFDNQTSTCKTKSNRIIQISRSYKKDFVIKMSRS